MGLIAAILALCIVALVVAGVVYSNHQNEPPANTLAAPEPPGPPPPSSAPLAPLAPPATAPAPPPSGTAREEAAQAVALQGKPGWAAVINSHEPDWSQVTVWIGPTKNDLRLARTLIWDPTLRAYALTQEGAVPQPPPTSLPPAPAPAPGPTPAPAPAPAANEPQPDREAALNAALANDPGYEARVVAHSADWKKVTVDTGLPMQPLSHEYRFHWDDNSHQYILDRMGPLGRRRR
jgi:hypothetical protein